MAGGTGWSGRFHSNACNPPRHNRRVERSAGLRSWVRVATQAGDNFSLKNRAIGSEMVCYRRKSEQPDRHRPHAWHGASHRCALRRPSERWIDLRASSLKLTGQPSKHELTPRPDASRLADRLHGEEFDFPLESSDHSLRVVWSLILLDGSSYLRQLVAITAVGQDVPISRVRVDRSASSRSPCKRIGGGFADR